MTEMLKLTLPGHPDYISVVKIAIGVAGRRQNLNIEEIHTFAPTKISLVTSSPSSSVTSRASW